MLSVRLDVHLDRQPITGRLRTDWGNDERFVGWLGFIDTLRRPAGAPAPSRELAPGNPLPQRLLRRQRAPSKLVSRQTRTAARASAGRRSRGQN
jgi:hypothetical protein